MKECDLDEWGWDWTPSMAEYAMTKKEMEIGVDPASKEGDKTVHVLLDRDLFIQLYWATLPKDKKRKIPVKYT